MQYGGERLAKFCFSRDNVNTTNKKQIKETKATWQISSYVVH